MVWYSLNWSAKLRVTPDKLTGLVVDVVAAADALEAETPTIIEVSETNAVSKTATRRRQLEPLTLGDCRRIPVLF
jgi:hypothetical protein